VNSTRPSVVQATPPRAPNRCGVTQIIVRAPPAAGILHRCASSWNPICVLSGDQNGFLAPSVPVSSIASRSLRDRTHRLPLATYTIRVPSGEISGQRLSSSPTPSTLIWSLRSTGRGGSGRGFRCQAANAVSTAINATSDQRIRGERESLIGGSGAASARPSAEPAGSMIASSSSTRASAMSCSRRSRSLCRHR